MDIQVHNSKDTLNVSDAIFGVQYNESLIHQVVTAYLAGARAGTKAQKSKAMVSGGGKKPWRQKGTGRARAGSIRSPIWRGGGKTFAAIPRDFSQKVNRKMYRGAMRAIVAELTRQGHLIVTDALAIDAPKTKTLVERLSAMSVTDTLIVATELDQNLYLSARNLPNVEVCDVEALNPVALLRREKVLMSVDALKKLEAWLQ